MNEQVDILLSKDNPHEAELAIRSLRKHHLANKLIHIDDDADALDFLFYRGKYSNYIFGKPSRKSECTG